MNEKSAYYIDKIRELEDEIHELKSEIREVHDVWHIKYDTLLTDYEQKWGLSMRLQDEVTRLENEIFDLKADRNAATIMEQQAEITALKKRVRELEEFNRVLKDALEQSSPNLILKANKEALELRNRTLTDAVSAHIKVCRGWFGDDHVWEQIIAHNEWEGKG